MNSFILHILSQDVLRWIKWPFYLFMTYLLGYFAMSKQNCSTTYKYDEINFTLEIYLVALECF